MKHLPEAEGFDIKDDNDVEFDKLPKADVYVHLAAEPSVQKSVDDPLDTYYTNVIGTLKVLEACRKNYGKIIFASSAQAAPDAPNPYALQKYHCEGLIELYARLYGVRYTILRLYNVFGEGEHGVIGSFLLSDEDDGPLLVYGGQQRRDFIHVDAVVRTIISHLSDKQSGLFHVGSGTNVSVQEIADMISSNQIHSELPKGEPLETLAPYGTPTITVAEYLASRGEQ